jgi:uncharacterized protein HemY
MYNKLFRWLGKVAISRKQYTKARDFLQNEFIIVQQLSCNKKPLIRYYNTLSKYYTENGFLDSTLNVALKSSRTCYSTK